MEENKLRVVTAFSGYDSQCMALDRLGIPYELIAWSEIDKYAIQAHNAVYPQWADRNLGDISKIDWEKVEDFDLFTYSFPCATKDSLILTRQGYKQLEDVNVGDYVLTKDGGFHKVAKKFDNGIHPTCFVQALGFENMHVTYNHKFLVRTRNRVWDNGARRWKRTFTEPDWKEVKDISNGDYFGIPVMCNGTMPEWSGVIDNRFGHGNIKNEISVKMTNKSFWYMMGRYVGDGWRHESKTGNGIVICCGGRNEQQLIDSISDAGYHYTKSAERTVRKYIISSNELFEFAERYGYKASGKRVDGDTMNLPEDMLKSFIDGCLDSDGCYTEGRYKYASVSRELVYGLAYCINRVYKKHCCIGHTARRSKVTIEGRECNQRDSYSLTFTKETRKQEQAFYEDGYIWYPFGKITVGEDEHVYNIEVESEHSYVMQGAISKNCTDISNAGLQKGLSEGSGTRSGLLWECVKCIKAKHPKWLLMENVKALVSKKFMPEFEKWLRFLESEGYHTDWQVMNAKDYGVPQNRERVFAVSQLQFQFPHTVELTTCLQDVLEQEVDESYYLSDETLAKFEFDDKFKSEYERIKQEEADRRKEAGEDA